MVGGAGGAGFFRMAAAALLAGAVVVPCALAAGRANPKPKVPDPKVMVVRLGDLPHGFVKAAGSGYVTNAKAQATEARKGEDFTSLGRMNGYEESLRGFTQGGQVTVASSATVFRTADGAHRALGFIERDAADPTRYAALPAVRLGAEARLYQLEGVAFTYLIAWRSGSVLSTVVVGGAQSGDAVRLGKRQQGYVAAAVR
jgi:hypothetical protein